MKKKVDLVPKWVSKTKINGYQATKRECDICGAVFFHRRAKRCSAECRQKRYELERESAALPWKRWEEKKTNLKCNMRRYERTDKSIPERQAETPDCQ